MTNRARVLARGRALLSACVVSLCSLALGACLQDPPPRDTSQWPVSLAELETAQAPSDPGEAAFRKTCIACHGADGKGLGNKTGADFTAPAGVLTQPDSALRTSVLDGKKGTIGVMPPHRALLTDAEVTAVLAYVRRTFGPSIVPGSAPDADAGTAATTSTDAAAH